MGVYDDEIQTAFEEIKAAGGPIKLRVTANQPSVPGVPRWRGNRADPVNHDGYAIILDLEGATALQWPSSKEMTIAAKGLPVVPTEEMRVVDEAGNVWAIQNVNELNINFVEPILYVCRVAIWPQS